VRKDIVFQVDHSLSLLSTSSACLDVFSNSSLLTSFLRPSTSDFSCCMKTCLQCYQRYTQVTKFADFSDFSNISSTSFWGIPHTCKVRNHYWKFILTTCYHK